jgi:hypothetical protein
VTDQPTTDDLLFPLLQAARDEDSLDITDQEIRDGHYRITPFASLARAAFDLGAQHAERKRLVDAPPVDTTDLDAAITDHLTRAQKHWLVGIDRAGALDHTAHMQHYIDQTRIAFYLIALRAFNPGVATHAAGSLEDMLARPPVGAMWLWDRLKDYGVDPAALTAFKPLKSVAAAEKDAHPLRYATTTPDGQVATGLVADELDRLRAELAAALDLAETHKVTADVMTQSLKRVKGELKEERAKVLAVGTVHCWTNEDDKRFVFADDLLAALHPELAKPGTGQPLPATVHPADGTLSAALTPTVRRYVDELVEMAGKRNRREQLTAEDQRLVDDVRALLEQDPLPADGTPAELSGKQDGAAA